VRAPRANSRAHRSEARALEVSTVLRSSGSALGTLAPRNATPPHHALAPPARARAPTAPAVQPTPCMEDSMIRRQTPDDDRGQPSPLCYSPLCGLRFAPLQGHDFFIALLPTLARKTLFASLRETSPLPFVHMDSHGEISFSFRCPSPSRHRSFPCMFVNRKGSVKGFGFGGI